jgi:hypothetical protein
MLDSKAEACFYCLEISKFHEDYPLRKGVFSYEGEISRCYLHAQFQCSVCGKYHHFSWLFWCPTLKKLICGSCNNPKLHPIKFWDRSYSYIFHCEACQSHHHDLLYSEFQGIHPIQSGFDDNVKSICLTNTKVKKRSSISF